MTFQNKCCTAFTKQHMAVGLRTLTENIYKFNNAYQNIWTVGHLTVGHLGHLTVGHLTVGHLGHLTVGLLTVGHLGLLTVGHLTKSWVGIWKMIKSQIYINKNITHFR